MISIAILGTGNVAKHLFSSFKTTPNVKVVQVLGRSSEKLNFFKPYVSVSKDFTVPKKADIYIIAVSDDAIEKVSNQIQINQGLVVHTSGTRSIDALHHHANIGVFYPLQSFSSDKKVPFSEVPICLEVKQDKDLLLLEKLAHSVAKNTFVLNSAQRQYLHLAAVFVNNFTNHLFYLGKNICEDQELPFELLQPLIKETVLKLDTKTPYQAQTGPAKRKDIQTITKHLSLLTDANDKAIYKLLSQSISDTYGKKL